MTTHLDTSTTPAGPGATPPRRREPGLRVPLRILAVGLSVLMVGWGAVTLASLLARATEHRNATFQGVQSVDVDVDFEHVTVTGSADATSVTMKRSYTWSLAKPKVSADVVGNRLVVSSSCPWSIGLGCSGSIELVVPRDAALRVDSSDGRVTLRDLSGPVDASSSDGSIEATGLTGALLLRSSDGSIDASGLRSRTVEARSSDGSVRLAFLGPPTTLAARSSDGSVDVQVPRAGAPYRVDATSSDGSRTVSVATDPRAHRRVDVHSSDGSVRVTYSD